jgi:hypothetical protein
MLLLPDFAQLVQAPPYSKSTKPAHDRMAATWAPRFVASPELEP